MIIRANIFFVFRYICYNAWFLANVIWFTEMVPEWLMAEMLTFVPGGFFCLFMGAYSFAADASSTKYRTLRIAVIDFVFFAGLAIGTALSGPVFQYLSYIGVFSLGLTWQSMALIYGVLCIKEKPNNQVLVLMSCSHTDFCFLASSINTKFFYRLSTLPLVSRTGHTDSTAILRSQCRR